MQTAAIWLVGTVGVLSSMQVWANSGSTADVHHCINPQNRAVFQDRPCEQSGLRDAKRKQPKEVAPATGPVRPAQAPRPAMPRFVGTPRTV
ncbi:MAG: hypothetical protein ACRCV9_05310 [Burkholderiaceae bacterium]